MEDIVGGVTDALGVLGSIYGAIRTDQYRSKVLAGISEIEQGIEDIEAQLAALSKTLEFWEQWDQLNHPLARIDTHYNNWVQKTEPKNTTATCNDLNNAMTQIHEAVCGEVQGFDTAISLYIATLNAQDSMTSQLEYSYKYFSKVLLGKMLRACSLLGAYNDPRFDIWHTLFKSGNPNATEKYLKKPYFQYEGTVCQNIINQQKNEFMWAGLLRSQIDSYNSNYICINSNSSLPNNSVITGYDFCPNAQGNLALVLFHGISDNCGYVANVTKSIVDSTTVVYGGWRGDSDMNNYTHYGFMDTNPLTVPDGHVIIDIKWGQVTGKLDMGLGSDNPTYTALFLKIKHAQLKDGVIDNSTAGWIQSDAVNNITVSDTGFQHSIDLPKGVVYFNPPRIINRQWAHWNKMHSSSSPPAEWDTPITGLQIQNNLPVFKASIHQNTFSK